jgi:hypothetical protein
MARGLWDRALQDVRSEVCLEVSGACEIERHHNNAVEPYCE